MTAVLVSHPHVAAVSAGLAERLAVAGKLAGFFTGVAFTDAELNEDIAAAYADFDSPAVAPLVEIGPDLFLLELFPGVEFDVREPTPEAFQPVLDALYDALATHYERGLDLFLENRAGKLHIPFAPPPPRLERLVGGEGGGDADPSCRGSV